MFTFFFFKVKISNNHSISKDNLECLHFFFKKIMNFFFQFKFSTTELEFNPNDYLICLQIF